MDFVLDGMLAQFLARQIGEPRLERLSPRAREQGLHGPVFPGPERLDLHFAFDDQTQAYRLHAAGASGTGKLAPENG